MLLNSKQKSNNEFHRISEIHCIKRFKKGCNELRVENSTGSKIWPMIGSMMICSWKTRTVHGPNLSSPEGSRFVLVLPTNSSLHDHRRHLSPHLHRKAGAVWSGREPRNAKMSSAAGGDISSKALHALSSSQAISSTRCQQFDRELTEEWEKKFNLIDYEL